MEKLVVARPPVVDDAGYWLVDRSAIAGELDFGPIIARACATASASGKAVQFTHGKEYLINSATTVNVTGDLTVLFNGAILRQGTASATLAFQNSAGAAAAVSSVEEVSYNLSVDASTNSRVSKITAPGHTLSVGDVCRIWSDDVVADSDGSNQFCAEYFVVAAVVGADIYSTGTLIESYSTNVYVCSPAKHKLRLDSMRVQGSITPGWNASACTVRGFIAPQITGPCSGTNLNGPYLNITGCYMANVESVIVEYLVNDTSTGSYGYGVNDSGSYGTRIGYLAGYYTRHVFTTTTGGQSVSANDGRWDLRGRSMFMYLDHAIVQGNACGIDTHASTYKFNVGHIVCLQDYRGMGAGGVGLQLRGNSVRVDSVEVVNAKTGLFVSGATKTSDNFISIGHVRVSSGQGSVPINLRGNASTRTKVVIDNLEFDTVHDSVVSVTNANVIIKYISGEFNPYQNGGELFELNTGTVLDVLDGDIYINAGTGHNLARHNDTGTVVRARLRFTASGRVSYLARSASQYDVQSEWDVHADTWSGTPFLGVPEDSAKIRANIRAGATSYPLRYRALTCGTAGARSVDLQRAGDACIVLRVTADVAGVSINSVTRGAYPGQQLLVNNNTSSAGTLAVSNNSSGLLTLGAGVTLAAGAGLLLFWDGSTWRKAGA